MIFKGNLKTAGHKMRVPNLINLYRILTAYREQSRKKICRTNVKEGPTVIIKSHAIVYFFIARLDFKKVY